MVEFKHALSCSILTFATIIIQITKRLERDAWIFTLFFPHDPSISLWSSTLFGSDPVLNHLKSSPNNDLEWMSTASPRFMYRYLDLTWQTVKSWGLRLLYLRNENLGAQDPLCANDGICICTWPEWSKIHCESGRKAARETVKKSNQLKSVFEDWYRLPALITMLSASPYANRCSPSVQTRGKTLISTRKRVRKRRTH